MCDSHVCQSITPSEFIAMIEVQVMWEARESRAVAHKKQGKHVETEAQSLPHDCTIAIY